jgi:hypothetical protein
VTNGVCYLSVCLLPSLHSSSMINNLSSCVCVHTYKRSIELINVCSMCVSRLAAENPPKLCLLDTAYPDAPSLNGERIWASGLTGVNKSVSRPGLEYGSRLCYTMAEYRSVPRRLL